MNMESTNDFEVPIAFVQRHHLLKEVESPVVMVTLVLQLVASRHLTSHYAIHSVFHPTVIWLVHPVELFE